MKSTKIWHGGLVPNLCGASEMFFLLVAAELLAIVLALAGHGEKAEFWSQLGLISLQVQWVVVISAVALCLLRGVLNRLEEKWAALACYGVVVSVIGLLTEIAFQIDIRFNLHPVDHVHFLVRNLGIGLVIAAVFARYLYVVYQWQRNLQAQSQARIDALQARIRPHFLFNAMNTIASLTHDRPDDAERVVEDLCELFRYTLNDSSRLVAVETELHICRTYLDIEKIRLGERLQVSWSGEQNMPASMPPLLLQPLLENAVRHGIEQTAGGGLIRVDMQVIESRHWPERLGGRGKILRFLVANTMEPDPGGGGNGPKSTGLGMALNNIQQRLQLWYGTAAKLIMGRKDGWFEVTLEIPYESRSESTDR